MAYTRFANRLNQLIKDSGMTRKQVQEAVKQDYAPSVQVTYQDLSKYLAGESLPRLPKLAAIADVCGATHGQIALLIRSVVDRNNA